jgi:hypothetical protein
MESALLLTDVMQSHRKLFDLVLHAEELQRNDTPFLAGAHEDDKSTSDKEPVDHDSRRSRN